MPESRTESNISTQRDKEYNPSVCIASSGSKRDIKCNYDNAHFIFARDENKSTPELFNSFKNSREFDAYVFLSKDYDFTEENSLNYILGVLFSEDKNIDSLYTDTLARIKGKDVLLKPQLTASKYILSSNNLMNIPFVVKQRALPTFNERYELLFLHIGIVDSFQSSLIVHYPRFCFALNNFAASGPELKREMEMLRNGE